MKGSTRAYALGMLTLALGWGCAKRHTLPAPVGPEESVAAVAAWLPEGAEALVVLSSLEALQTSWEEVEARSFLGQAKEALEAFYTLRKVKSLEEGAAFLAKVFPGEAEALSPKEDEEEKEEAAGGGEEGPDFFALSTWQEMGFNLQAPLMAGLDMDKELVIFALPVVEHARFLAAIEKHVASKAAWEAQPGMPEGLYAWETRPGHFVLLAQKPGRALILTGKDLEVLKKKTQLSQEKSWARHKDALLRIHARLPAERLLSVWVRLDKEKVKEVAWVGAALTTYPKAKAVVDVTWRPGEKPWVPPMQRASFGPQVWLQSLGGAAGGFWSAVEWDWYFQWLQRHTSGEVDLGAIEIFSSLLTQNFEPPLFIQSRPQTAQKERENLLLNIDIALKPGAHMELLLNTLTPFLAVEKLEATPLNPDAPAWKTQLGDREILIQMLDSNRLRISDSAYLHEVASPNALQATLLQEMMKYPLAAILHLNVLLEQLPLRLFAEGGRLEKAEYFLLGARAEEDHAQLIWEHFIEAAPR